jgi:glycosyltransferase involved in cell wall biosynthesis
MLIVIVQTSVHRVARAPVAGYRRAPGDMPMRIEAFASNREGSSPYRAWEPLAELERRGHTVLVHRKEEDLVAASRGFSRSLGSCDVVYISRYMTSEAQRLARALMDAGVAVVWDHDDDYISAARASRDPRAKAHLASMRAMLERADVVTTTNERLAGLLREAGGREVVAIPNRLTRASAKGRRRRHRGIVVGWIAWRDHQDDWDRLKLAPVFERLLDAHPELRIESVGPIDLGLRRERYHQIGAMPYERLPDAIAGFDVGIAPLADRVENLGRSDIKLKEYAIAGVPWLASALGPYVGLGEQQGGRLVADGRWYEELDALVSDARLRRRLGKQARRWAKRETLAKNADAWEAAFAAAIEHAAARRG